MSATTSVVLRRTLAVLLVGLALSLPQPVRADGFGDWGGWGNNWSSQWSSWGNDWNDWSGWFDDDNDWWDDDWFDDFDWYDFDDWKDHDGDDGEHNDRPPVSVPEPASLTLLVTGLVGLGAAGRRRNRDR